MKLFERKDCMLTVYTLAAVSKFGLEALQWDPLILRDAFQNTFNCKLSQKAFDKLMAGTAMVGTNLFTASIQSFLACTAACNNKTIKQTQLSYVSLKDCCWAVFVWKQLIGYDPNQDSQRFDQDIIMYIQSLMTEVGISKLPDFMSFAQFSKDKLHSIETALISDITAFQAYNTRQLNEIAQINAYIKDKQKILIQQLKQMRNILDKTL